MISAPQRYTCRRSIASAALVGICALIGGGFLPATAEATRTQTTSLSASSTSKSVTLKGWATFSGAVVASGKSTRASRSPTAKTDGSDLISAAMVYRPEFADFYIRWRVTKLPSRNGAVVNQVGDETVLYAMRTAFRGVPVEIRVQSSGVTATYQLYKCSLEQGCTLATSLTGSFGTTGEEVVVTIPMSTLADPSVDLAVKEGDKIGMPFAFTARAPIVVGAVNQSMYLDSIVMGKGTSLRLPKKSVRVTVGKATKPASLNNGRFAVAFPRGYFKSSGTRVKTRTCLGASCRTQYFTVKV